DAFEHHHRPGPVIEFVGTKIVGGIDLITRLGVLPVEGERQRAAAAFLAIGAIPFVGEEAFQGDEQECAELAFVAADAFQIIFFEQAGKESLREIFGILARMALPSDIRIKRIPVGAAQFFQGNIRLLRIAASGGKHGRPMRRGKNAVRCPGLRRWVFRAQGGLPDECCCASSTRVRSRRVDSEIPLARSMADFLRPRLASSMTASCVASSRRVRSIICDREFRTISASPNLAASLASAASGASFSPGSVMLDAASRRSFNSSRARLALAKVMAAALVAGAGASL